MLGMHATTALARTGSGFRRVARVIVRMMLIISPLRCVYHSLTTAQHPCTGGGLSSEYIALLRVPLSTRIRNDRTRFDSYTRHIGLNHQAV